MCQTLILSINKGLPGKQVKKYIENNVQKFDQYNGYVKSGGLIDVGNTLKNIEGKYHLQILTCIPISDTSNTWSKV